MMLRPTVENASLAAFLQQAHIALRRAILSRSRASAEVFAFVRSKKPADAIMMLQIDN